MGHWKVFRVESVFEFVLNLFLKRKSQMMNDNLREIDQRLRLRIRSASFLCKLFSSSLNGFLLIRSYDTGCHLEFLITFQFINNFCFNLFSIQDKSIPRVPADTDTHEDIQDCGKSYPLRMPICDFSQNSKP